MKEKELEWDYSGKIRRKFSPEWANSGFINMDKLPEMVEVLVSQRKEMLAYIEALHNKMDDLFDKNHICDNTHCHTAYCTSDHK